MKRFKTGLRYALAMFVLVGTAAALAQDQHGHLPEVTYTATEEGYEGPDTLEAGFVELTLQNDAETGVELQVIQLLEDVSDEEIVTAYQNVLMAHELEAMGAAYETLMGMAAFVGGPGWTEPGQSQSAVVELAEGTHVLINLGMDEEGPSAIVKRIEVTGAAAAAEAPEADATVQMVDFSFAIPGGLQAGEQTWEIVNEGEQPHHLILMRLQEGATIADIQAFMEAGEEGEPPAVPVSGTTVLTTGNRMFVDYDLEPGNYIAACFVHDPETGAPHVALGMLVPFTIE